MLVFLFVLSGCVSSPPEDFVFSYERNSIEDEHLDDIQSWLQKPDQTRTRTIEFNDETKGHHFLYAHSAVFSEVEVKQKDDAIILMFTNKKTEHKGPDALVKIKFNPKKIKSFVLNSE